MIRRKRRHWPRIEQQQITDGVKKGSEKVLGSVVEKDSQNCS